MINTSVYIFNPITVSTWYECELYLTTRINEVRVNDIITDTSNNEYQIFGYYNPGNPSQNEDTNLFQDGWKVKLNYLTNNVLPTADTGYDSNIISPVLPDYLPEISWSCFPYDVSSSVPAYTYTCKISEDAGTEPGSGEILEGYYLVDNEGSIYKVLEILGSGTGYTEVKIYDITEDSSNSPSTNRGYIYKTKKDATILSQSKYYRLDQTSRDKANNIEKAVLWENRGIQLEDSIGNITENVTKIITEYTSTTGDWEGGSAIELELGGSLEVSENSGTPNKTSLIDFTGGGVETTYDPIEEKTTVNISVSGGGDGTIGQDEDDDGYINGLFDDFTEDTEIGTPIDRFNQVLKSLAPSPAPSLGTLGITNGVDGYMSFDESNPVTDHAAVSGVAETGDELADVDKGEEFAAETTVSGHKRGGVYGTASNVSGTIADGVSDNSPSYAANSFGDADKGSLKLYVDGNASPLITVDLTSSTSSITQPTGNGSKIQVSALQTAEFANGDPFELFKYRTGTWEIDYNDLTPNYGHHYLVIEHEITPSNIKETNYVDFVIDGGTNSIGVTGTSLSVDNINSGSNKTSGITYASSVDLTYSGTLTNVYENTYRDGNVITFSGNGVSFSPIAIPAIGSNSPSSTVLFSRTANTSSQRFEEGNTISATVSCLSTIPSENLVSSGSASQSNFLIWTGSQSSENYLSEDFNGELARIDTTTSNGTNSAIDSYTWDSSDSLAGDQDLIVFAGSLRAPAGLPNSGNINGITNAPSGNPDYSSNSGIFTYIRRFKNTTGTGQPNFSLQIWGGGSVGGGTTTDPDTASGQQIRVEVRNPDASTLSGWKNWNDIGVGGSYNSSLGVKNYYTWGSEPISEDGYLVVRITAQDTWENYLSSMTVIWETIS